VSQATAIEAVSLPRASSFSTSAGAAPDITRINVVATLVIVCLVGAGAGLAYRVGALASTASQNAASVQQATPASKGQLDRSGQKRIGKASFYAKTFAGKTMADGTRMDPRGANAASRTLPLGTTAKITNLETGQSAIVSIQDRGPYAKNRIVDLSPSTAQKIGISKTQGVAKVEVAPIAVPQLDGSIKAGVVARVTAADQWISASRSQ
jgi:rare lipoprotein A